MDIMVQKTQIYLNAMYGHDSRYEVIPENGNTGWTTIYALTRALQIELGITETADNFGPTTISRFKLKYPNGITQQDSADETEDNVYAIIQGALWCKGYSTGASGITKHFYGGTGNAIINLKEDAGLIGANSTVTLEVMQALLSMNQYVLLSNRGGIEKIRSIQQYFNWMYMEYIGLAPCDGLYAREMNKAMIKVLQAIEGYSVENATGNFGAGTKAKLPMLPSVTNAQATYLFRAALCCNGYDVELNTIWNTELEDVLAQFQTNMLLDVTRRADTNTWMALMLSCGNQDRPANACDTRFEITAERLNILKANGYEVVGRYLTGGEYKGLRIGEAERIINGGMKLFPIFQESGANLQYFTESRGSQDAVNASVAAREFGMPVNTIIYFAVDTDPLDTEIRDYILPYFKGLFDNFDPDYQIGVYGTRNVCSQLAAAGYTVTSFVSDMSYAFSGNMGFRMPGNWNLDQYYEIKTSKSGWDFDLDKVAYAERFPVVSTIEHNSYVRPEIPTITGSNIRDFIADIVTLENLVVAYYNEMATTDPFPTPLNSYEAVTKVTNFLRSQEYNGMTWFFTTAQAIDTGFVDYVESNNPELFSRISPYISNSDKELLKDNGTGVLDLSHLAATIEGYIAGGLVPSFWAGWGGDLATGMSDTTINCQHREEAGYEMYSGKSVQEIANMSIGKATLRCNYSDFCCDFDAYAIQKHIKEDSSQSYHKLSDALNWYYTSEYTNRFYQIYEELGCSMTLGSLREAVYEKMNQFVESVPGVGLLALLGDSPTEEVNRACCNAFANYIYSMR